MSKKLIILNVNVTYEIQEMQGMLVLAGKTHQLKNNDDVDVIFTVTSTPPSHGDRIEK